jgi:nucleotide-binding universal stress UspA family protein
MRRPKEAILYRKILVGYDNTDESKDALALGKQLAEATGAELVVAGVFQFDPVWGDFDSRFRDADVDYARQIEAAANSEGAEPEAVPSSSPARGLHELAEEIGADMILVGSAHHGRVGQLLAGSTGVSLLHGSPCAVGIAPRGYRERSGEGIDHVAVGFDGSAEAGHALMAASALAAATGATLKLVSIAVPPPIGAGKGGAGGWHALVQAIEEETREELAEARNAVPEGIDVEGSLITGDPVEALTSAGQAPGTLMVVGSRAYGPLRRVLLGSVSTQLVRSASCPLIVTPRGMRETAEPEPAAAVESTS